MVRRLGWGRRTWRHGPGNKQAAYGQKYEGSATVVGTAGGVLAGQRWSPLGSKVDGDELGLFESLKASFILIYHYQKQIEEETHIVAEKAPAEKKPKARKKLPKESGASAKDKNRTRSLEGKI
ncbi:hypothetical protein M0R45_030759 [Rubus argutus]|uniref:Uncharacterized protein n=1 Tax=Rubus argutus TaxID=59490 RepID=A0AAW1WF70_RUBAR